MHHNRAIVWAEHDIENMMSPTAGSRSSKKDAPLVFVSTNTAVFSEASRTAARSHAAAWSRRRLKEAKAKPKADQGHKPATDDATTSDDSAVASPCDPEPCQTLQRYPGKTTEANAKSIKRQPEEQLSLSVRSRRSDARQKNLFRENDLIRRGDSSILPLAVCGKNGALDPFDSLAVKIDSHGYDHLQFYRQSSPWAWELQPYALNHNNLDGDSGDIVSSCMSSKLHYYTFLSLSAAVMETLGIAEINFPHATLYSHRALTEMQVQLRHEPVNEQELLHGVSTLSIAAALQGDAVAARAHLRAAKYLVERLGGFDALKPSTTQRIRYGDFHLALETLSPPVFALNFEPDGFPKHQNSLDPLLEQLGQRALQFSQMHLPLGLFENARRIIQCAEVLDGIWAQPNLSPVKKVEWLASKTASTMNRLLSTTIQIATESHARKVQEATRVSLILWNLITLLFAKSAVADTPVRGSMPIFGSSTLEAMRDHWPPWIHVGLMSWNDIVRSPSLETENKGTFWSLINVVRSMEAEGLVRLADLMDRLCQLEDIYRIKKRQQQALGLVLR